MFFSAEETKRRFDRLHTAIGEHGLGAMVFFNGGDNDQSYYVQNDHIGGPQVLIVFGDSEPVLLSDPEFQVYSKKFPRRWRIAVWRLTCQGRPARSCRNGAFLLAGSGAGWRQFRCRGLSSCAVRFPGSSGST